MQLQQNYIPAANLLHHAYNVQTNTPLRRGSRQGREQTQHHHSQGWYQTLFTMTPGTHGSKYYSVLYFAEMVADIPLICSVGQVALRWLIVVRNADVRAPGNHVHITEVHAVCDVGEEQEMWVSSLVQDAEPVADIASF